MTIKAEDDEVRPLSGKPYFHLILANSHVKTAYNLAIPAKMHTVLPCAIVPVTLTYRGKSWETIYYGDRNTKRFDISWKQFAIDNDLRVGDACVFELMDCSSTKLKFTVQVLRGDFPSELQHRVNGETSNTPIVIE